ncbi:MAG: hypothetical protein ABID38_04420, partial [Candidatus Diapherotrites archaeon]
MKLRLFGAILLISLLLLLSGCTSITDLKSTVDIGESGNGTVLINLRASQNIQKEITELVGDKKNKVIERQKVPDTNSTYDYKVTFDFDNVSDLSQHASFRKIDEGDKVKFIYEDIWSSKNITGKDSSLVDFDVCIKMPGKIKRVEFDSIIDKSFIGKNTA